MRIDYPKVTSFADISFVSSVDLFVLAEAFLSQLPMDGIASIYNDYS